MKIMYISSGTCAEMKLLDNSFLIKKIPPFLTATPIAIFLG